MSTGFVLNIPQEMINRLEDADKKIEKLAKTSEEAQTRIVSAFKSINTHGIDAFINKLTEAQTKLSQLGNTQVNIGVNSTAIDEINRIITAVGRARTATGEMGAGLSPQSSGLDVFKNGLDSIFQKIERLKNEMNTFRQWEGGNLLGAADYAHIGRVTDEINRLMQAYIELDKARQTIQQKDPFKAKVDDLSRESLEAQRYKDSMQAMKEFYAEQDKEMKKAAKEAEADRKKREKEEKATADRIAAYDSKARRERYKAYTSTYEGAMRTSDRAKTLLQEQQAIKNLEAARAKLNKTDSDYANKLRNLNQRILEHKKNIDKATTGSKNLQTQHRSLMDISGQLARKLALVFSVSQITGYVKKLIEVRGEFELQQRSLQAILQNKDEANRIWQQTVDLAVRSPFRVKELVSYTKQLAAYRIESDKLFETNKMLADISAGLGVDMQRLILAFGQVRSAAYLRGTELRQFTEAGIPILEQLAQYFTELEGRAVSVGDVFERVSKRMVSFADVEEIFRRMTSEGGTFYRMQEIQAETLKGMWSNLKDSVDIMVNEIGKGNESTLKNSLALVKQLVDNWRKVKPVIETAGISLMTYFGVDVLRKIGRAFKALWTTISAHPVLAVASAFALLATYIWRAAKAQTEFNAAMSEVENENIKSLEDNIRLYHELRDAVNDVTKSSEDREKAYNRLKSVFDDILPQEYLAKEYVEDLSKGYKNAEKAMTDYYDAKTQAQKRDRIEGLYAKELDTDISELITSVRNRIETRKDIPEAIKPILQSGVSGIVNEIIEEVKSGDLANDIDTIADEIQKRLEKYGAIELPWTQAGEGIFHVHDVKDIVKTLGEYKDALEDIQGLPFETYGQKVASEWLNKEKESLREISDIYKKLLSLYSKYSKATDEDKVDIADDISLAMSQVPEKLNAYLPLLQESVDKMKGIAEKGAFEFTASMQALESDFVEGLAGIAQYAEGEIGDVNGNKIAQTLSNNLQEGIQKASDKLDMTPFQNAVVGGARQIAERFGQDVNIFEKFIPNQKESLSNIRQEVKSQIESYETQILEMQTSLTQGMYVLSEEVLNNTKETIKSMTDQLPALKAFLAFLGEMEKDKGRKDNTTEERIKVVDQMNAKYKELNKTLSETDALEGAFEAYKDAFATAYGREDVRQMSAEDFAKNVLNFPDEDAVIAWLDNLAKTVKDKEDKFKVQMAKGKFEMDVKVRLKKEDDQQLLDDIQELFDRYDLSLELKKLNIPPDLAKSLFDVDYLDLEGLKAAIQDKEAKFIGTDMEDEYKKFLEKIDDMEDKAAKERMKTYVKYLQEGMSERVKLKIEELRKLKEIEESDEFTPAQKERIKANVSKEARAEQQVQEWKDFQGSEMYTMMFEDLEFLGTKALDVLKNKLEELKGSLKDLPASEVKEIIGQISKIEDITIQRNPFTSLREAMKEVRELESKGRTEEVLQEELAAAELKRQSYQEELDAVTLILGAKENEIDLNQQSEEWQEKYAMYLGMQTSELEQQSMALSALVTGQGMVASNAAKDLKAYADARKALSAVSNEWGTIKSLAEKAYGSVKEVLESMGVESDSVAMSLADSAMNMVDLVFQAVMFDMQLKVMTAQAQLLGVAMNTALGPIGWIVLALQAVATLLSAILGARDKALQKTVEDNLATVERLQKTYEDLEESIDNAWDTASIQAYNKELKATTQSMIDAQKAAIAAQEKRKGANKEGSDAYNELQEMKAELDELEAQLDESLANSFSKVTDGILDSVHDAAREFTDAWWDAFVETGDGLKGLEENFNEMFLNLAKNQAAMQITGAFAERWEKDLEKYINANDTELTKDEAKKWAEEVRRTMPELSAALEGYLGAFKDMAEETEGAGLSALTKGIQGVSESTAQVLESLLNSMRFYVADSNAKLTQLLNNMMGGETESPMLAELRAQTKWMRDIYNLINGMTATHPSGGRGIKTVM